MAAKAACARALLDIFYRRVSLTAFSAPSSVQHGRCFVSVSQHYLSPQPPKKPAGAFFKFMNTKSSEILSKNPGASLSERSKIASQMWHALDVEERNRIKLAAREELQAYREKYLMFLDGLSDQERAQLLLQKRTKKETRANRKHKMELKKFGKPKLAPNAFMLFVRSSRLERGNAHPTTFVKGLVEYWRQMPEEEKDIYREDARLEREKYQQEMKEWEERMKEMGREDLIRKKSQQKPKKVTATKAKKKTSVGTRKPKTAAVKKSQTGANSKASTKKPAAKATSVKKRTISKGVQTEE